MHRQGRDVRRVGRWRVGVCGLAALVLAWTPARAQPGSARTHYTIELDTAPPTEPEHEYGFRGHASRASPTQPLVISPFRDYKRQENKDFEFAGEAAGPRDNDLENHSWELTPTPLHRHIAGVSLTHGILASGLGRAAEPVRARPQSLRRSL